MRMGIPAMNSTRTRALESLLFPSWPERRLHTLRPEKYAFWVRWGTRGLAWVPFAIGMGWWLGTGWGVGSMLALMSWSGWLSRKVYRGEWATTMGNPAPIVGGGSGSA